MREGIHPPYVDCVVTCACGNTFKTRSTKPSLKLEICSSCHPFFTGKQKLLDSAGRVERFQKRFAKTEGKTVKRAKKVKAAVEARKPKGKVLRTSPHRKAAAAKKAEKPAKKEK